MDTKYAIITIVLSIAVMGCTEGEDIYVVKLSPPDMIKQLELGQIDGFVAWEPFVSKGVSSGGKVLLHSEDIWQGHPCCVVAHVSDFNDKRALKAVIYAHIKATEFIKDPANREEVISYASEFTGLDKDIVTQAMERIEFITFPEENDFRKYFRFLKDSEILNKNLKEIGFEDEDDFFNSFLRKDIYEEVIKNMKEGKIPEYTGKVRIGYLTADLHQLALFVAVKEGYFNETGMNLELKQYRNGVAVMEAFRSGEIDVAYLGGAPATLKRINDDIKVEIIAGANNEGSAIVVQPEIKDVSDLKGKTIAIPGYGTVQDFLLRLVAEKNGLKVVTK